MSLLALIPLAEVAIKRLFPDPVDQEEARLELLRLQQQGDMAELDAYVKLLLGQLEVNTEEAKSSHWFVAAWRPFVGWVCGLSVAWNFVVYPTVVWFGVDAPSLDISNLMVLLMGMLGIGGMRSFDKLKGVDTENITS